MKLRTTLLLLLVAMATQAIYADDIIKVCGQNVQNFFYSLDRGRTTGNSIPKSNYTTEEGRNAKLNAKN